MDSQTLLLATPLVLFLSALVRSTFGFGDALLAMPLLTVMLGIHTTAPLVGLAAVTMGVVILRRSWREVRRGAVLRLVLASFLGIPAGLLMIREANETLLRTLLSALLIGFSLYRLLNLHLPQLRSERGAMFFGFLAGILGGAYNTNGPAVVVYGSLRRWPPAEFVGTLQAYFLPTGILIAAGQGVAGLWTAEVLRYFLIALPAILLALYWGGKLQRIIPPGRFDRYIHLLLILMGLLLLIDTY